MSMLSKWIIEAAEVGGDECMVPPFKQNAIYWKGRTMAPGRAVLINKLGEEAEDYFASPVRTCMAPGCVNPNHWKWGTLSESRASAARLGVVRVGNKSGNKKVTVEVVEALRSDDSLTTVKAKKEKAEALGITYKSLDNILSYRTWRSVGAIVETGDEF